MPDDIERTIYKLEIDDSGYIRGIDSLAASTKKFTDEQNRANERLKINEQALKDNAEFVEKTRKALEAYTGTNERYRKQLEKSYGDAQKDQIKLNDLVIESRKSYEQANKAAQDFADTSARATQLQQQTTGGKIPTAVPLGIQSNVVTELQNIVNTGDLSGLPQILNDSSAEFEKLRAAIATAEQAMTGLNAEDAEFVAIQEFVAKGKDAIAAYDAAVKLATVSTAELGDKVTAAQAQIAKISATEISELPATVEQSKTEFDELRVSIEAAETRLQGLDNASDEFKKLAPVVNAGKVALQQYDAVAIKAGSSTLSLRSQIRIGREELVRMEQAGKSASKEFFELEKRVASLTDAYGDQQERIKVLASDTRVLDFGKASIQTATAAFQAYTSVSILAGGASEELQRKTLQLFAAMQVLTALETLSNSVKRGSVIATNLQAVAQGIYTTAIGASTGALRTFRVALLATGIGAAVLAVGFLVAKWMQYSSAVKEAERNQKLLNEVVKEANQDAGKQIADLKILTQAVKDSTLPMEERLAAVKALQKEFPEYFGNLSQEAILTGDITKETEALTASIQAAARARAAKGKIDAIESEQLDLDFKRQAAQDKLTKNAEKQKDADRKDSRDAEQRGLDQFAAISEGSRLKSQLADIQDKKGALQRQEDFLVKFVGIKPLAEAVEGEPEKQKTTKALTQIQNDFEKKKAELDARLAALRAKEADDESKIRIEFAAKLAREQLEITKNKNLTAPQKVVLKAELAEINTVELDKALEVFRKKVIDARNKLEEQLHDLQEKATLDSLNLIQDDFDRRAALIDFNEKKELAEAEQASTRRLEALELERLLIGEQAYQDARAVIIETGEQNVLNIVAQAARERQALAADTFKAGLDFINEGINQIDLARDETTAKLIREQSKAFLAGTISFEVFQRNITKIKNDAEGDRRDDTLFIQKAELADLDIHIANVIDKTSKEYADLLKLRDDLRKKIAAGEQADAEADAAPDPNARRVETVQDYVTAIAGLTDSVIALWQAANAAESAALDRSIALQERRVDAAQRIAERGNAQYLKAETDRLKELQVARENAARRELAINAALQASQLLVGITGAITKIATPGIGTAEVIAAIAVIFGALATGYGLVKSLQGNQPRLKAGTTYVSRETYSAGTDTIPAWLTEGEAVIPTRKNKQYKKAVEAIYHGTVPAEDMNTFVENYVKNKRETHDSFVNNYTKDVKERKAFTTVQEVVNIVTNRLNNIQDTRHSAIVDKVFNENKTLVQNVSKIVNEISETKLTIDRVKSFIESYSKDIVDRIIYSKYKNFVDNVSAVPASVVNKFVEERMNKITNIVNEVSDKKVTVNEVKELISRDTRKVFNIVESVNNKLNNTITSSKYSEIIDKALSENKSLVENKNVIGLVHRIVNEVSDKKFTVKQITSLIENKTSNIIHTVVKLINERVITSIDDVRKYSEIITKNENLSTYRQFVHSVSKVSPSVLNHFITNYQERKYFRGTPDLKGVAGIDKIPVLATAGEAIIPAAVNTLYKPAVKAIFEGIIPPEQLNNFIKNYHTYQTNNPVVVAPSPNYQRIKEAAETHISSDGKLAGLLVEHSNLLKENNELQKQILKKNVKVEQRIDRDGVAQMVTEFIDQQRKDSRI